MIAIVVDCQIYSAKKLIMIAAAATFLGRFSIVTPISERLT